MTSPAPASPAIVPGTAPAGVGRDVPARIRARVGDAGPWVVLVGLASTLAMLPFEGLLLRAFVAPSWRFTLTDENGKVACGFSDPEAIEAFKFIVSLYRDHRVEAGAWQTGSINPEQGFLNGKYAMILTGPWNLKRFEGIDFGVSLVPSGPAGTSSNVGGSNMVVFRSSANADTALDFLRWFTSRDMQLRWAPELGQIPVNREAFEESARTAGPPLGVFLEQLRTAKPLQQVPKMDQIEDRVINPALELALKGQSTPEEIMREACRRIDEDYLSIINER